MKATTFYAILVAIATTNVQAAKVINISKKISVC